MSDKKRHPQEQLAHDVRNSAALVSGALAEIRAGLGASASDHEIFLRIAGRGVKQLLLLADRCAVEGEQARLGAPTEGSSVELDSTLKSSAELAQEAFGKKTLRVEMTLSGEGARLKGPGRWISVVLTESVLLALKSAAQLVRVTALTDSENATIAVESDGARPLDNTGDTAEGQAFQQLAATLTALGGSATTNAKAFRLLLTFPLLPAVEAR